MSNAETTIRKVELDDDHTQTQVVVEVELPQAVVSEIIDEHGDLDKDAVSDRVRVAPTVDGTEV